MAAGDPAGPPLKSNSVTSGVMALPALSSDWPVVSAVVTMVVVDLIMVKMGVLPPSQTRPQPPLQAWIKPDRNHRPTHTAVCWLVA